MSDEHRGMGGSYVVDENGKRRRVAHTAEAPRRPVVSPAPEKKERKSDFAPASTSDNKPAAKPAAKKE